MKAYIVMLNDYPRKVVIDNEERAKEVLSEMRTDYEKRLSKEDKIGLMRYWHIFSVEAE